MNSWRAYWLLPQNQQQGPLDAWSKQLFPNLEQPAIHVDVFGWHSPRQCSRSRRAKTASPFRKPTCSGTRGWPSPRRMLTSAESPWSLSLYGMEDQLLRFTIDAPADDPLAVIVEERMPGLPGHLLPPGASKRMPGTGTTVSSDVLRFY